MMRLNNSLGVACLALLVLTIRGPFIDAQASSSSTLSAAELQADFAVLRNALEEAHGALYRFTPRPELDKQFDQARARLNAPMSRFGFIELVSATIADIHDGHSRLEYDSATSSALARARLFPLRPAVEGSRLIVQLNDTPSDTMIRPGMEIISVNGHRVDELVSRMLPAISGDGFIETGKRRRLARGFGQLYWLFVERADTFAIVARDSAGRTVRATLSGVLDADRDRNGNAVNAPLRAKLAQLTSSQANVSLRFLSDPEVAYLRVRAFDGQDYPRSIDSIFGVLRQRGAKALVLDLRGNGGGVDMYGAHLVSQFVDKPFRYFDRIHLTTIKPSFATWLPRTFDEVRNGTVPDPSGGFLVTPSLHPGVAEQSPAANVFAGRLYVLIDGGSFSTTADVTAKLRDLGRATFIGEETAGAYEGNTSGLNALVVLPNSGLRLKVEMYGYWNAVSPREKGRGTIPDHVVPERVANLLRGIDAALESALAMARTDLAGKRE
ncbi:MAG: S41 family peptidase [bacterium]